MPSRLVISERAICFAQDILVFKSLSCSLIIINLGYFFRFTLYHSQVMTGRLRKLRKQGDEQELYEQNIQDLYPFNWYVMIMEKKAE